MGYVEIEDEFCHTYDTWIIAYCIDTDSFFCTNQRHFFYEFEKEFPSEKAAIVYFKSHLFYFQNIRSDIAKQCGGISQGGYLYLENTKERW